MLSLLHCSVFDFAFVSDADEAVYSCLFSSQTSDISPSVGLLLQTTDQDIMADSAPDSAGQWYFEPDSCEPSDNFFMLPNDDTSILNMFDMFNDFV